jgi:hypothetical protein
VTTRSLRSGNKEEDMKRILPGVLLLTAALTLAFAAGCKSNPPGSAPENQAPAFTKTIDVFGVTVYATKGVADDKMLHAAGVLGQYLDNDQDGVPDDPAVIEAMVARNASLIMARDEAEMHAVDRSSLPPGVTQGLWDEETRPGGAAHGIFDASIEEVLHLVSDAGYGVVYPEAFATRPGSKIALIMDEARGGHFEQVPEKYPETAWYTYYDATCEYDCQISEYFYWALTSILGGQDFPGRLEQIGREWRFNTREKVEKGDPKVFALLTDPQYHLPTVLPDGDYRGKALIIVPI